MHAKSIQEARDAVAWLQSQPEPDPIPVTELETYTKEEQTRVAGYIKEWTAWAARADELLRTIPFAPGGVGVLTAPGIECTVAVKSAHPRQVVEQWLASVVGYADAVAAGLGRALVLAGERQRVELIRAGGSPS